MGNGGTGNGREILIVEDEVMVAFHVKGIIEDHGYTALGPAPSVAAALALLGDSQPSAALLDANLQNESVAPVAQALRDRGIPFAVVTGYGRGTLPDPLLQAAPRVRKPYTAGDIARALASLCGETAG